MRKPARGAPAVLLALLLTAWTAHGPPAPAPSAPDVPSPSALNFPASAPSPPPPEAACQEAAALPQTPDIPALQAVNGDVLGWLSIPGTGVSYPLLRSHDNQEYLSLAWDGTAVRGGSIFLECQNQPDLSDFHTLVYGHNMGDGSMFAPLHRYREPDFWEAHPHIYITTASNLRRYTIFSAYEAQVVSDTYRLVFRDEAQKRACLDMYATQGVRTRAVTLSPEDHILTLSTCTQPYAEESRWVVHSVLEEVMARENSPQVGIAISSG